MVLNNYIHFMRIRKLLKEIQSVNYYLFPEADFDSQLVSDIQKDCGNLISRLNNVLKKEVTAQ